MYQSLPYSLLIASLFSFGLLGQTVAQPAPTSHSKTVRTETCWTYPIVQGIAAKDAYCSARTQYNRDGRKSKMSLYDETGQITKEYLYAYMPSQCETYQLLKDGSKLITNTEKYDSEGQVIEHTRYTTDGSIQDRTTIAYDQKGRKVKEEYHTTKGEDLQRVYAISYAHYSSSIRESYTNYTDQMRHIGATELDENQLPKLYSQYASSGEPLRSIRYERNSQGRLTSIQFLKSDASMQAREDYEYNGSNIHCLVYQKEGKELVEHVMYQYDYYQ